MCVGDDSFLNKIYLNDSSKEIWEEFYKPFYSKISWDVWKVFDFEHLRQDKERYYARYNEKNTESKYVFLKGCELGGEMDFNFNSAPDPKKWREAKYGYYKRFLEDDEDMTNVDRDKAKDLLDECRERSKKRCNFSILIRTGGLNNVKGKMSQDRRALDRFNVFIFILDDYFEKRNKQRGNGQKEDYMHIIFSESWHNAKENRETLYKYLKLYGNIEDYLEKNYNINDKKLVRDLIKSGSKPIDSGERVVEYLRLVKRYWDTKEDEIKKFVT